MSRQEVIKLLEAGYSKAEIEAMTVEDPAAEASGVLSLKDGPDSGSDEARSDEPGQDPQIEDPNEAIKSWLKNMQESINDQIKELKEMQQQQNARTFHVGEEPAPPRTTRDVFEDIYNPVVFRVEEE